MPADLNNKKDNPTEGDLARDGLLEVDLAKELGLPAGKVKDALVVKISSQVKKGQLLAAKKSLTQKKLFFSPVSGIVESISEKGVLGIRPERKKEEKNKKKEHQGKTKIFSAKWGRGDGAEGKLKVFDQEADLFKLNQECAGQILVLESDLTRGFCYKAGSIGVKGLVCRQLADENFALELEKEVLFLDGEEKDICLPVLIFGHETDEEKKNWSEIKKQENKMAILEGEDKQLVVITE